MHLNVICSIRTASTYLMKNLAFLQKEKLGASNVVLDGEIFNKNKIEHGDPDIEKRLEVYLKNNISPTFHLAKIVQANFIPGSFSKYPGMVDKIVKAEGSVANIFLYREDILDTLMSNLICLYTKINNTSDPNFKNSITSLDVPNQNKIEKQIQKFTDIMLTQVEIYNKYKFDAVLKYEDFTGNPSIDFGQFIDNKTTLKKLLNLKMPQKMFSLEHKKTLLPYEMIKERFETISKKKGLPEKLPFESTGLGSLKNIIDTI